MKKVLSFLIIVALLLTSTSVAFAKPNKVDKHKKYQATELQKKGNKGKKQVQQYKVKDNKKAQENKALEKKAKHQDFKINGSPVIKYGRYLLPISPVTKGMGATLAFDKETAVLTVTKGSIILVIDFKNETVTVNGVADTTSGIFAAKNDKKMTVLIKYIAKVLGVRTDVDDDEIIVEVPGLDAPTNVTVTPVGDTVLPNTLNTTTLYITASASIKPGQATGGKAELYVGSKLVSVDANITATDTTVTFSTSDNTPTNEELKASVPAGGAVVVKLYNAQNQNVASKTANPTLTVDYEAPSITTVTSAVYSVSGSAIYVNAAGAGKVGDKVDVTRIAIVDPILGKTYQLTNTAVIGSAGSVSNENTLVIHLGIADQNGLASFGSNSLFLNILVGSLLSDEAGNVSPASTAVQAVPVTVVN